jgi:hypothetical protein
MDIDLGKELLFLSEVEFILGLKTCELESLKFSFCMLEEVPS